MNVRGLLLLASVLLCLVSEEDGVFARRACRELGCPKFPSYGAPGTMVRLSCLQHKDPGHVYLPGKKCQHGHWIDGEGNMVMQTGGCLSRAYYAHVGDKKPVFCAVHKEEGMEFKSSLSCKFKTCKKQPVFGDPKTRKKEFCSEHKSEGMVDVVNKRCKKVGCGKQASYGSKKGRREYCGDHRKLGDVLLSRKKCARLGCPKQPYFGSLGSKTAMFCSDHKPAEAIDVKNKRCLHPDGCDRHPAYGDPDEGSTIFCSRHKMPHHIDLKNKRCQASRCSGQAIMAPTKLRWPRFCSKHAPVGYVNIVTSTRCNDQGCKKRGIYGDVGVADGPLFCNRHRSKEHVVKKSGRAARLESRLWGSYVDSEAVQSGIVLWSDANSFRSLYEDTYLLLITQGTGFTPSKDAIKQNSGTSDLILADGYVYNGPDSATLKNKNEYVVYIDENRLAAKICLYPSGKPVWDREESMRLLMNLMSDTQSINKPMAGRGFGVLCGEVEQVDKAKA